MKLSALVTIKMKVLNGLESADFPLTGPPDVNRQALDPIVGARDRYTLTMTLLEHKADPLN